MTPALLLRSLEDALRPLVVAEKGFLSVCETPEETMTLLGIKPSVWRCLLQWEGHQGDAVTYGTSKVGRIGVIVQTARGLQIDRGADAHRPPVASGSTERPILELIATVNTFIRGLVYTDDEEQLRDDIEHIKSAGRRQCFNELSGDWLEIEGIALRQYLTTFSIRYTDDAVV